jgi:WD40 repeat protein
LWDAETGQEIRTLSGHTDWVYFVAFSPDGKRVLTGSRDCTAKLWDAETGQVIRTFSGHAHMIVSVAFSPDGTQVLVSGSDTALLWDAATGMLLRTLPDWDLAGSFATVWWEGPCWGFSPDGTQVFAGTWDGTVELWDAATGALIRTFSGRASEVLYVAFSPDGTRLLASGGAPTLWDAATGTLLRTFPDRDQFSFGSLLWQGACWGFSPDGAQVFAAAPGGTVELWDAATGALIRTFSAHAPVAFSPDGKRVLTASLDCSTAKLWDAETGQELCTFSGHTWRVNSLAFSPDGTRVLTGSDDRTAKLWDAETGQVIRTFSGHTSEVYSVAFSPDGKRVLTECGFPDDTKLWDAETAQEIRTFSNVHRPASFSPDGTRVLTHYYDGTARIWDISDLSPELPSTATPTGMPVPTPTPTPTSMRPHPRAIAEAYPDTAQEGQHVTLDGSSSIYTYCMEISWSQTRGFPIVAISNSESLTASFIVPAVISATELEFQLTLRDCWGGSPPSFYSSSDRVSVTILPSTITPTATPTPIEEEGVYVFDRPGQLSGDLTGQTDFDPVDTRNLTIYWNAPQGAATDWHIYIRKGLGGMRYLGRTGSGTVTNLDWYSGAPGLGEEFRNGPDFNSVYVFRLIRIDGKLGPDDYFDPGGPVGFNLEGGNPVSLSQPAMPNLEAGQICIYDDILGGNDLAPVGSIGSDTDDPGCRAIQIAWNFGADTSTVNMYHVQVSVNNGDFEYLGQTGSGDITYFWWTPTNEFNTAPSYASGPEGGRTYQFRVVLLPLSGPQDTLTSGKLMYSVTED